MSLTAARPAGGDKPRPYILRVSGDRKYVVGAAFMGPPAGDHKGRPYAVMRWDGRPFSVVADAPGPLRGNSPSAHIGPTYARLMHLPCNPFLYLISCQASGGPLDGSLLAAKPLRPTLRFRFPPLPGPHLWNLPQVVLPIAHRSVWGHGKKRPAHGEKPCAGRFLATYLV